MIGDPAPMGICPTEVVRYWRKPGYMARGSAVDGQDIGTFGQVPCENPREPKI
jgi:hypothetical protein